MTVSKDRVLRHRRMVCESEYEIFVAAKLYYWCFFGFAEWSSRFWMFGWMVNTEVKPSTHPSLVASSYNLLTSNHHHLELGNVLFTMLIQI